MGNSVSERLFVGSIRDRLQERLERPATSQCLWRSMIALGVCFKKVPTEALVTARFKENSRSKARTPREVLTKEIEAIARRIHARGACGFAIGVGNMYLSSQPNRNLHQVVTIVSLHGTAMQSFPSPDPMSLCLFPIICKSSSSRVSSSVRPTPPHRPTMRTTASSVFRGSRLSSSRLSSGTGTTQGAHAGRRQGKDVLRAGGVLSKAGVGANDAARGLVRVEGHRERLRCDKPVDAFGARGSSQGPGVAERIHVSIRSSFINRCDVFICLVLPLEGGLAEHGNEAGHGESRRLCGGTRG